MRKTVFPAPVECLNYTHQDGLVILPLTYGHEKLFRGLINKSKYKREIKKEFPHFPLSGNYDDIPFDLRLFDLFLKNKGWVIPAPYDDLVSLCFFGRKGRWSNNLCDDPSQREFLRQWVRKINIDLRRDFFTSEEIKSRWFFIEGVDRAVKGGIVTAFRHIPARIRRWYNNRFKTLLFDDHLKVYSDVKEFITFCDRTLFNYPVTLSPDNIFHVMDRYHRDTLFLQFRYMARSLPHPDKPSLEEFTHRAREPAVYDINSVNAFHRWFSEYVDSVPGKPHMCVSLSNSSSLERLRSDGGQSDLYESIIQYQLARIKALPHPDRNDVDEWVLMSPVTKRSCTRIEVCPLATLERTPRPRRPGANAIHSEGTVQECLSCCQPVIHPIYGFKTRIPHEVSFTFTRTRLLVGGAFNLLRRLGKPASYLAVLVTEERGGKWRSPCKSSVFIQILGSLLRSVMDHFLKADPRIRGSLTGQVRLIKPEDGYLLRSQDLSLATDNHPFVLTKGLYEVLGNKGYFSEFPFWQELLNIVFPEDGRILVSSQNPLLLERFSERLTDYQVDTFWQRMFDSHPIYNSLKNYIAKVPMIHKKITIYLNSMRPDQAPFVRKAIVQYEHSLFSYYQGFDIIGLAVKGPSMGEPFAWPSLPLVTLFCYERSHKGKIQSISTYGDDGQFLTTPEENALFNLQLRLLGSVVSEPKDVLHPTRGIFIEIVTSNGQPIGGIPIKMAYGMPSSKEKQTYYSIGPSVKDQVLRHKCPPWMYNNLIRNSPFMDEIKLCHKKGIDVNLPIVLGGLGLHLGGFERIRSYKKVETYLREFTSPDQVKPISWSVEKEMGTKIIEPTKKKLSRKIVLSKLDYDLGESTWRFRDAVMHEISYQFFLDNYTRSVPKVSSEIRPPILGLASKIRRTLDGLPNSKEGSLSLSSLYEEVSNPILKGYFPVVGSRCPNYIATVFDNSSYEFKDRRNWAPALTLDFKGNREDWAYQPL